MTAVGPGAVQVDEGAVDEAGVDEAAVPVLDTTGHRCPIPVVRAEAALRALPPGGLLAVLADDPLAAVDIPHFCRQAGHAVSVRRHAAHWRFLLRKGG